MADEKAAVAVAIAEGQTAETPLLDQIVNEGRFGRDASTAQRGRDLVKEFVAQVLEGHITMTRDAESAIQARIAQIDQLISKQLNKILHHPSFQKLEGTWRGIHYLLNQSETGVMLKLKVLNVSKRELLRDLQRVPEFDQSSLFKKVYEEEYGVFGGSPFAALIGDYEFGRGPEDMELLRLVAQVAASAHAPFLSAAAPELLNLDNFTQLGLPRDVAKIFDSTEYAKWRGFRMAEDSRYVGLTLPRVLARLPYGKATNQVDDFDFEEDVDGSDHSKYLWSNAAYALGARLTNAFAVYGWCASIRGVEGGGLLEDLPSHIFETEGGDAALKCPTEVQITDRREKELADQGLVPLVHCKGNDYAAFFSVQSVNKPRLYDKDSANANARLSAQLPYIFAMSRFAHYLKAMMRDKIGSFTARQECEVFLNRWISTYVLDDDTASQSAKAQLPLREARIEVSDVPGKPGAYRAIAFLRPHFQLDELTISLRLVAELPESARS